MLNMTAGQHPIIQQGPLPAKAIRPTLDDRTAKAVIENLQAGVVLIDEEDHVIVDVNAKAAELIGCDKSRIIGSVCHEFICPAAHGQCPISDLGQKVDGAEKVLLTWSGKSVPILKTVTRMEIGGRRYILDSFVDISRQKAVADELRDSEERFRVITSSARDGIIMFDNDGNVEFWNQAAERIFGHTSEEVVGRNLHSVIAPPRFHTAHGAGFAGFRSSGTGAAVGKTLTFEAMHRDGHEFPVELSLSSVMIRGQWHAIGIVRDIGERLKAETRFKSIFEGSRDGILIADPVGKRFVMANPAMEEILGYSAGEILALGVGDIHPPEELPKVIEIFERQVAGELVLATDLPVLRKDGRVIYCDINSTMRRIGSRDLLIGVFRDVTERRNAQRAVQESERKYRLLSENSADVLWSLDLEGRFTYVSPAVERLRGFTADEVMAQSAEEALTPEGVRFFEREMAAILQALSRGDEVKPRIFEIEQPCKDGSTVWTEVSASLIIGEQGEATGIQGVSRDITERRLRTIEVERLGREWQDTFDSIKDIVMMLSDDHTILRINRAGQAAFGKGEVVGRKCYEVVHGADRPIQDCPCLETIRTLRSCATEVNLGNRCYIATTDPILGNGGELVAIAHTVKDITDRKRVETELMESKEFIETAFDAVGEVLSVIDANDYTIKQVNRTFLDSLGFSYDEVIGRPCYEVTHRRGDPCGGKDDPCPLTVAVRTGKPAAFEHTHYNSDGEKRIFEVSASPIRDKDGNLTQVVHNARDITERKKLDDALKANLGELERYKRATVDRELRMVELKTKVKQLEAGGAQK